MFNSTRDSPLDLEFGEKNTKIMPEMNVNRCVRDLNIASYLNLNAI